jgi:type I restriction enzyme M protein
MSTTQDIVARLWNLCHVLRDDGITYHEYVTELTFLLFLKMAKETGTEEQLPTGYRWDDLQRQEGVEQLGFYRSLLVHLGNEGSGRVQAIFHDANTALRQPRNLTRLVESIDALDWYSAREEGLGDLYKGLLEKNASEKKSGAGQYFTPRPLIECMVNCIQPQPGEIVQDPAAGTGGFLIMADRYIKQRTDELFDLSAQDQEFQRKQAFVGVELVPDAHRLLLMNAMLHGIESDLLLGDTLSSIGARLPKADVILPELNQQWLAAGLSIRERAERALHMRHTARLEARAMMADLTEVELLRARDMALYGNADGPTFAFLVA